MEWVEKTGASLEAAKEAALDALGVHEDEAEFEIVNDVEKGLFGRVKSDARVRARVAPTTPRAKDDRRRRRSRADGGRRGDRGGHGKSGNGERESNGGRGKKKTAGSSGTAEPRRDSAAQKDRRASGRAGAESNQKQQQRKQSKGRDSMSDEQMMPLTDQADIAEEFVKGLAEVMGSSVTCTREDVSDDEIRITVAGPNIGRMIGQRGAAANAIDDLTRTVLQRHAGSSRNGRVRVDVGGLRARRAEALAAFCRTQAALVREDGEARVLEPMGSADRKIVHDTITEEDGVHTLSEGEDPNRRVVIAPAGDAD